MKRILLINFLVLSANFRLITGKYTNVKKYEIYCICHFMYFQTFPYKISAQASDLNRCCAEGRRYFSAQKSCPVNFGAVVKSNSDSSACARTASICCLQNLFDRKCSQGESRAQQNPLNAQCSSTINNGDNYGAGFERVIFKFSNFLHELNSVENLSRKEGRTEGKKEK